MKTILTAQTKPSFRYNTLPKQRISSIDTFRGITILVMIFVNEVAGVSGIPSWMKHVPADADAITFVDVVFPAFLFIVGMSVPFALQHRLTKGDSLFQLQIHVLSRTLGLLVLGVLMVNAEDGYNEAAMGIPIALWSLGCYVAAILVWNVYTFENPRWTYLFRGTGIVALLMLAAAYRGGDGTRYLQPHWWGILGLIGWAYFYTCVIYQLLKGSKIGLLGMIAGCTLIYVAGHSEVATQSGWLHWTASQAGNAAHTSIVLCGLVLSLIFFDEEEAKPVGKRFMEAGVFTLVLLVAGWLLRPYYFISKIHATPSWCFYSAASCCIVFAFLYWWVDLKKNKRWTTFFQPAASNPLLTYLIPYILFSLFAFFHFYPVPSTFQHGLPGIFWCLLYATAIMWLAKALNRLRIRLQL